MEAQESTEKTIFKELSKLCNSKGYIYCLSFFAIRDTLRYVSSVDVSVERDKRLIRTEISLLFGLVIKEKINFDVPDSHLFDSYIDKTEQMLSSLQRLLFEDYVESNALRESIFYAGESAYPFQYIDFAVKRYADDDNWLKKQKGFSIFEAGTVILELWYIQTEKVNRFLDSHNSLIESLDCFKFHINELISRTEVSEDVVLKIMDAFSFPNSERNSGFLSMHDFSIAIEKPIINLNNSEYLCLQIYSLCDSLYISPYYWFSQDKDYFSKSQLNRGNFTEQICIEKISPIFKNQNVFKNIDIYHIDDKKKCNRIGEVDVLVIFGHIAIILQAKSQILSIEARKGNKEKIQSNFELAVQKAYDQAYTCANSILDKNYNLFDSNQNQVKLTNHIKSIYIICVTSEHYPALHYQSTKFLKIHPSEKISAPFVTDIFLIDVLTEMLNNPLYFLSYIDRRVNYYSKIDAEHEIDILSYHLQRNLWLTEEMDFMVISNGCSEKLDGAMFVRRMNIPGDRTPPGILTRVKTTMVFKLLNKIKNNDAETFIKFGFLLLKMGEKQIIDLSMNLKRLSNLVKKDGKHHTITLPLKEEDVGIIFQIGSKKINKKTLLHLKSQILFAQENHHIKKWFGVILDYKKPVEISYLTFLNEYHYPTDELIRYIQEYRLK